MSESVIAQLNIAALKAPIDSPQLEDFVANLDRINSLAENSPGYIWRLKTDEGNATSIGGFGDGYIVNLSVWKDIESLKSYVYESAHIEIMRRRKEWFEHMKEAYSVLWWVAAKHRPTVEEAKAKLTHLRQYGPTANAFTFKRHFENKDRH